MQPLLRVEMMQVEEQDLPLVCLDQLYSPRLCPFFGARGWLLKSRISLMTKASSMSMLGRHGLLDIICGAFPLVAQIPGRIPTFLSQRLQFHNLVPASTMREYQISPGLKLPT